MRIIFLPIFLLFYLTTSLSSWADGLPIAQPSLLLSSTPTVSTPTVVATPIPVTHNPTRAELALFAMGLIGAVYKPGGENPELGMDCSGFVRYVFHEVAGLKLPHNAFALSKIHDTISKADLKPGDLVFFKTLRHTFSHVGIYLGQNQFVHADSGKVGTVMISHLDSAYWSKHYEGARRVLSQAAPVENSTADNADPITAFAMNPAPQ